MSRTYNRIKTIADRLVYENQDVPAEDEIRLSNYYGCALHDAMEFLVELVFSVDDESFSDVHTPEGAKKAIGALEVIKDYQLLISMIDSNLLEQPARAKLIQISRKHEPITQNNVTSGM